MEVLLIEDIVNTWNKVFPHSLMSMSTGALGGGLYGRGLLGANHTEWANGIYDNDILSYRFSIVDGVYKEYSTGVLTNPPLYSHLVYSSARLRAKSIKNVTLKSLEKRFMDIKQLVVDNKDNFPESLAKLLNMNLKV